MSGKNQFPNTFNWQSTDPRSGFNATNNSKGSAPSGNASGSMTGTSTIYSNIIAVQTIDNVGLEIAWSGTPIGVITIYVSNSGINWPSLTFTPPYAQPSGSAGVEGLDINQLPYRFIMIAYTNTSGSGTLTAYGQQKDLN